MLKKISNCNNIHIQWKMLTYVLKTQVKKLRPSTIELPYLGA